MTVEQFGDTEREVQGDTLSAQLKAAFPHVKWELTATRPLYDKPWMRVNLNDYRKADGTVAKEFVQVESADYVEILPFDPETGKVVLIVQYHWGADKPLIKLPAGKIKRGQTPLQAAQAELAEETGTAGDIHPLTSKYEIAMWYKATAHYLLAYVNADAYTDQKLDTNEEIVVVQVPIKEVYDMIMGNDPIIMDEALSLAVLYAVAKGLIDRKFL